MRVNRRRVLRAIAWIGGALLLLVGAQVVVLAYPDPWFARSAEAGNLTIHSRGMTAEETASIARNVLQRVEGIEIYDVDVALDVFVCNDQKSYRWFARLALIPPHVPGFNLSLLNNTFVSAPALRRRAASNGAGVRHSAIAGDLEHCIAHELVHDYGQERIGFLSVRRIPAWKTEGYAEFGAARVAVEADSGTTLFDRVTLMQTYLHDQRTREYYQWNLVVEFLIVESGCSFADIMANSVTLEEASGQMVSWYESQRALRIGR